jgi:tetratricopeptide (TPR) repeat protein
MRWLRWGWRGSQGAEVAAFRAAARKAVAAREFDAAIEALGQAALLRPHSAALHAELGVLMRRAGHIEAARGAFGRALELAPGHAGARAGWRDLPPEPPRRANFVVGQRVDSGRGSAAGGILRFDIRQIRRGGFGVVYLVQDVDTGRNVALKSFDARLLWSDDDRARFVREATTWINLAPHPNVVTATSVDSIEGFPCLVMDFIDGGDLADRLAAGPLGLTTAVELGIQLCDGMEHAGRHGVVHRDLKPSNCMLTSSGTLKVTDFGLATALRDARANALDLPDRHAACRLVYTTVAGTPAYMAPEQFRPGASLDTRVDVFAFGVTAYQMLTGRVPQIGLAHRYVERWRTSRAIPGALTDLVRACVDPDPGQRPATFADVRGELAAVHERATGTTVPPRQRAAEVTASTWVDRSIAFRNLGRADQALDAAERGLKLAQDGSDQTALGHLWQVHGLALVDLDRAQEAAESYLKALELVPEEPTTWVCMGAVLTDNGADEEALECYDECLRISPDHPTALRNKALSLHHLGRLAESEATFRRAGELIPKDVELQVNWAGLLQNLGRYDEAQRHFDAALAIAPRSHYVWLFQGELYAATGHADQALAAYDRSLEINRRDLRTWDKRGKTLREMGRPADALACYDQAIRIDPDYSEIWVARAAVLLELGRRKQALDSIERALRLRPDDQEALALRERA